MIGSSSAAPLALALVVACSGGGAMDTAGDGPREGGGNTGIDGPATDASTVADKAPVDGPHTAPDGLREGGGETGIDGPTAGSGTVADKARAVAVKLRGDAHFLIGLGNDLRGAPDYNHDLDGAYRLGTRLDLHYAYITGFGDQDGWPTWNTGGTFVNVLTDSAAKHGVAPMFTYYALALELENEVPVLEDAARMRQYLLDVKLMFQRLRAFGKPSVVHFEPDFFGYLQQLLIKRGTTTDTSPVKLRFPDFHDCDDLPQTAHGLGRCLIRLGRTIAPTALIGFHASMWADWWNVSDPAADIEGKARSVARFLRAMGADETDMIVVETLDRDAGFWETNGGRSACSITNGPRGPVYWDESNSTLPNFHQHFRWVKAISAELELPVLWWQTPLGVPSMMCGGTSGHWRDNRVHYFFNHVDELMAAGGLGVTFGTGAGGQTTIDSDDGQFKTAVTKYFAQPFRLP